MQKRQKRQIEEAGSTICVDHMIHGDNSSSIKEDELPKLQQKISSLFVVGKNWTKKYFNNCF